MSLLLKLNERITEAQRNRNTLELNVLRAIKSAIEIVEKSGKPVDENAILRNQLKRRKDSIEMFVKGGRVDLAAKEADEVLIIEEFLPKAPSMEEVNVAITQAIADCGEGANRGQVIKRAKEILGTAADGAVIAKQVALHL